MTTRTTQDELKRLQALGAAGYLNAEEQARLAELEGTAALPTRGRSNTRARAATVPAPTRAPTAPTQPAPQDIRSSPAHIFIPLDTESFDRGGGGGFMPPPNEGIWPGVCEGITLPEFADDQAWFRFKGTDTPFSGALITAAITREGERSGAWKVKDVLVALGVPYEVDEGAGVHIDEDALKGVPCQVEWSYIDNKGKRELRIQNVYGVDQPIEGL